MFVVLFAYCFLLTSVFILFVEQAGASQQMALPTNDSNARLWKADRTEGLPEYSNVEKVLLGKVSIRGFLWKTIG